MLIAPENIYENRLFKNVTLNFSTVSKNKDNLVFILGSKYSDYNTVFKSKLFKPNQLYSVFAPRAIRLFNGKIVRIKQVDLYDQIMNETNGFIRMGKIIPNSYNEYNVLYDILPEYNENNNLLSKMYKNQSAILHGRLTKTLSDVIRNGINTFGYKKNYVVVPITEAYSQSIRNLIKLKSYPVFNPAIEFIKILDPESEYNHDVLKLIDRVIFINPDSQTTFVIDPNNPETMKDFPSILLKIIRLYNYNNGQDNLEDIGNIDTVIEKDIDHSSELKLNSAKIESIKNDEYDDTKEKIVNAVLTSVGKNLKTKLTDFNSATIEEKGLINSINSKVDKYLDEYSDNKSDNKSFDDLVKTVENDKEIISRAVAFVNSKIISNKNLSTLSKNLKQENEIVNSILELTPDSDETVETESLITTKEAEYLPENIKTSAIKDFNKSYQEKLYKKDMVSVLSSFSNTDQYLPATLNKLEIQDSSDEFNEKETAKVSYKVANGKSITFTIDIPKVVDNNYLYIGGNKYIIGKQLFHMPITKTKNDRVEITTNFQKIIMERTSAKVSRTNQYLMKILKNNANKVQIEYGDNSVTNSAYTSDFEYEELATSISKLTIGHYTLYFNREEMASEIKLSKYNIEKIPEYFTPIGFNSQTGNLFAIDKTKEVMEFVIGEGNAITAKLAAHNLFKFIAENCLGLKIDKLPQIGKSFSYSTAKFLTVVMPTVVITGIIVGLESVLKRNGTKRKFSPKKIPINEDYVEVRFQDGYFYYENTMKNTMLLNALTQLGTENYNFADFNTKEPYVDYLVGTCGQPIYVKNMLQINLSKVIDPITAEVLRTLKLPTNIIDLLLLGSEMLINNTHTSENSSANFRIRGNELIAATLYKILADAYRTYENATMNGSKANIVIPQKALINNLISSEIVNNASVLNPLLEAETMANCTPKGFKGINLNQAYKPELRAYDRSMEGYLSANATAYSGSVGINRSMSYNTQVKNLRGYLPELPDSKINGANILSTSEMMGFATAAHNDPPRIAMEIGQQKHLMPVTKMSRQLIGYGVNKTLSRLIGDEFVFKAKKDGILEKHDDINKLAILKYDDGTYDAIDIKEKLSKNANSGFYISQSYKLAVSVNDHFKKGDIIAYNESFFSKNPMNDIVEFQPGTLARVAVTGNNGAFEDSCLISDRLSVDCSSYVTKTKGYSFGKNTIINYIPKVGDHIAVNDTMLTIMKSFQDRSTVDFLRNLASDELEKLATDEILAKESGEIVDIDIYYNCDFNELDSSVQKLILDYEKKNELRIKELKERGISLANIEIKHPYAPETKKIKGTEFVPEGGFILIFYIRHQDKMGAGDKLSFSVANKGVVSTIYKYGDVQSESGANIDAICTPTGIISRMTFSMYYQLYANKILVTLGQRIHNVIKKN